MMRNGNGHRPRRRNKVQFTPERFLASAGLGRTMVEVPKKQVVFSQGDAADSVFYIQKGKVKVTVISERGKEAVVAIVGEEEFCGEGCLSGQPRRISTATTMAASETSSTGQSSPRPAASSCLNLSSQCNTGTIQVV